MPDDRVALGIPPAERHPPPSWSVSFTNTNATTTNWYAFQEDWARVARTTATGSGWVSWTNGNTYTYNGLHTGPSVYSHAQQRQREDRARARVLASDRASELLMSLLSDEQAHAYHLTGEFEVMGSAGGLYRVRRGTSGNIDWIDPEGQVGARLCAHPTMAQGWMPEQDVAAAQVLALITDEPGFVRVANVHWGRRPPVGVR